jgi:hypothetical protein
MVVLLELKSDGIQLTKFEDMVSITLGGEDQDISLVVFVGLSHRNQTLSFGSTLTASLAASVSTAAASLADMAAPGQIGWAIAGPPMLVLQRRSFAAQRGGWRLWRSACQPQGCCNGLCRRPRLLSLWRDAHRNERCSPIACSYPSTPYHCSHATCETAK